MAEFSLTREATVTQDVPAALSQLFKDLETTKDELRRLKTSLRTVKDVAPVRPLEGDFVFADGTNFNPGSGRGLYQRVSGAWVKL